jgi:calcium permeable stress-gated cation channel
MLAVLMALLPIYLRFMAKMAGLPTYSAIELRTQAFYFWFQVIQVFIVTTLTSAASAAVPTIIKNPGSVTSLLAENLPKASNFYIDYFILQGLTFSSGALLQIVGLIVYKILSKILGSTPRKQYARWATLSDVGWGTVYPILR